MQIDVIDTSNIKDLSSELLDENKRLKLLLSQYYRNLKWDDFRAFCHHTGRYGIPTIETIAFLKGIIGDRKAIEIGAGNGDFGHHLGIHMTDRKIQDIPEVKMSYILMGQPTINYPSDVEELEALIAVGKHKPQVVIASWVTMYGNPDTASYGCNLYGIDEVFLLKSTDIETYILIGNKDTHGDKPIMNLKHTEYEFDWHVSRAKNQENNRIWVWNTEDLK